VKSGVLLVDKPPAITSHDVVYRLRRALGEKRVGHAGTLDPMATGLIVALVGEATKLEPYLGGADKAYEAIVELGRATDTLDREGTTTAVASVPDGALERATVEAALAGELARTEQVPPAFSAIHVEGRRSYDLARAGDARELPARPVALRRVELGDIDRERARIAVLLEVSKGYYVRSFARDLGARLGAPSHLASLRRIRSGAFDIARAVSLDAPKEALEAALIPLAAAAAACTQALALTSEDVARVRVGKPVCAPAGAAPGATFALLDEEGARARLVAMAEVREGELRVRRGFSEP